ncbi:LacI family DNA-binding transcriptional regulator [Paenibacillus sp. SI8]|uniref:LacI family DNA-binding transcriptional regulator n=1 Tax=unclassified Paenibacillus TaxID=185978 RepID=UPI003464F111
MKRVTMQQIADQVGVSKFAVSQALSGKPGVGEETRAKIIQTATSLGYNLAAQWGGKNESAQHNMKKGKSSIVKNTVIVLMPKIRFQERSAVFWGRIVDGVSSELQKQGTRLMMVTENNAEGFIDIINPSAVLGLIGIGYIPSQLLLEIRKTAIPFVLIDHEDPLIPCDSVFINNYDCFRKLTVNLVALGHRRMRFVGNPNYSRSFHERWLGFRTVLEENRLVVPEPEDPLLNHEDNALEGIEQTIDRLIESKDLPHVFVCANDFYAHAVMRLLIERGIRIPEDVSITGFDNTQEYRDLPSLTTVHVHNELMGVRAVEVLLKRLRSPDLPFEKTLLFSDVIVRQSVGKRE